MYLNEIKIIGFVGQNAGVKSPQNSKELVRFDVAKKASAKTVSQASTTLAPSGIASWSGAASPSSLRG